ncbi:hypothetical protein [Flavobacterium gelatinilyticum]|uniref:hypothetical protein n=1 Tax=Flavobacterium gelatinilyticum TaxID=3003260 RepID=UPI002481519C|nr:hypothetical protein [Flavobacterium gelatinilyticum]
MKSVLIKYNIFLFILIFLVSGCKDTTQQKITVNQKTNELNLQVDAIDSLIISTVDKDIAIFLNKVYIKDKLNYEVKIINSQNKIHRFNIPYNFISKKDTLQPNDLELSKITYDDSQKKVLLKNGFCINFWQSKTLFQYVINYEGEDFYLKSIKRIVDDEDLKQKFKIRKVNLNDNLKNLEFKKIDSIINNFDD